MNGNFLREVNFLGDSYLQFKKSTFYLFIFLLSGNFYGLGMFQELKKKLKFLGL